MTEQNKQHGWKGKEEHQALVAFATSIPYHIAHVLGYPCFVTSDEDGQSEMAKILKTRGLGGNGKPEGRGGTMRLGGYYPDVIWEIGDHVFSVEVGGYNPDRAPEHISVFHIAFNGKVNIINPTRGNFDVMIEIANMLRDIIGLSNDEARGAVDLLSYG